MRFKPGTVYSEQFPACALDLPATMPALKHNLIFATKKQPPRAVLDTRSCFLSPLFPFQVNSFQAFFVHHFCHIEKATSLFERAFDHLGTDTPDRQAHLN